MALEPEKALELAKAAYDDSTSYVDENYRQRWEDNIRHFQSRHAAGSKYNKATYKYRSKMFRPKTRSAVRGNEAAAMSAFFGNQDVLSVEPQNPFDDQQKASAAIVQELIQYRLTVTIPWFQTCIGAFQDGQVMGACCSYQYWEYETRDETRDEPIPNEYGDPNTPVTDDAGNVVTQKVKSTRIVKDQPCIDLVPIENVRFSQAADWRDPVKSSPFFIHLIPMYLCDVRARMGNGVNEKTGEKDWKDLTDGEILAAMRNTYDSTRQERDHQRGNKYEADANSKLKDFDVVWVHRNFVKKDGIDYVFYTLGTEHMLSDPVPIDEVYWHGERPYAIGVTVIEAHQPLPGGVVDLGSPVQKELNENVNQRLDNVKFVLNKRFIVKRNANVDIASLVRNVPGGAVLADNPTDVIPHEFNDVTASAYQEQDRLNLDFDELVGAFSASTINANRRMGETVGGMSMLKGSTNSMVEYTIRTFAETWVERVMRQLVKLEQYYESDEVILGIAADKAQLMQRYGINQVTDDLLNGSMTTVVNVGAGSTDPVNKVTQFMVGVNAAMQALADQTGRLQGEEVAKEIFGRLGYKDGERFLVNADDPAHKQHLAMIEQLKQIIAQLQAALNDKSADREAKLIDRQIQEQGDDRRLSAQLQTDFAITQIKEQGQTQRNVQDILGDLHVEEMKLKNPVAGEKRRVDA